MSGPLYDELDDGFEKVYSYIQKRK